MELKINNAETVLDKTVKKGRCSGYIYLPNKFVGKNIKIIILKDENTESNTERRGKDAIPGKVFPEPEDLGGKSVGAEYSEVS